MKKTSRIKCVRTLAWIMTACLTLTMTAPGLTAFAAEEYEGISVSADHEADSKENGESSDMAEEKDNGQNTSGMEDTEDKTEDSEGSAENDGDPDSEDGSAASGKSDDESDTTNDFEGSADAAERDEDSVAVDEAAASDKDVISDEIPDDEEAAGKTDDSEADADYDDVKDSVREDEIDIDKTDVEKDEAVNEANEREEDDEVPDESDGELENDIELLHASPSEAGEDVCSVGEKTYPSITDALAAIRESGGTGTVKLLADNVEDLVFDGKDGRFKVTLDMNGYDLYGRFDVGRGADVTFTNGTVYSGSSDDWIYASGNDDSPTRFTLAEDATINAVYYGLCICGKTGSGDPDGTGFVVTIDGTVEATDSDGAGIWLQGNMKTISAKVCDVIVNGTVKGGTNECPGIAMNGWSNVTVNDGAMISAGTGIEVRAGTLTVNGGTISGSTENFRDFPNGHGSTSIGAGIMINEHTTGLPITVNIRGGDIFGYYAVAQDNTQDQKNEIDMTISGGTFTGYDEECAILIKDFADNEEKFTIVGGTFMDSNGNVSDISVYLSDDCELDDNGNVVITKPDISEGGSEVIPDEDTDDDTGTDDSDSGDNNESAGGNAGNSGSGSSGHHSSGSGGGSYTRPAVSVPEYIGANGMKATWSLNGLRFTKADGTHPSNEYLIIDGVIYAFYTGGYAVSMDNAAYYSRDVVPPIEDIPVAAGTWDLCGWSMRYSDGSYPRSDWANLSHNGRSDWYYFDEDGWMETGWQQIGGCWYYFGADGAMLSDTQTPDGHRVDVGGRLIG